MHMQTFSVHLCILSCNSHHPSYPLLSSPYAELAAGGPVLHTKQQQDPESLAKLVDEFLRDVLPLLASGITYNPHGALELVQHNLISRLPGDPWKGLER